MYLDHLGSQVYIYIYAQAQAIYSVEQCMFFFSACAPTATKEGSMSPRKRTWRDLGQRREALADLGASICFLPDIGTMVL